MRRLLMVVLYCVVCVVAGLMIMAPILSAQSPGVTSTANIAKAGMDPERLTRIPARMKEFVDKGTIAGAVTLVARHGVVASLEAVGYQDLETKKPMRTDTIFQIMSMTKPVTAVGIMILLEEGRLLLRDPVEKYLPEFRDQMVVDKREGKKVLTTKKPSRPITIRDLLTHTSGMAGSDTPSVRPEPTSTLAERVSIDAQQPLEFEPGTKFHYSSGGFVTLGRITEVVSNQPYEAFIEQRILRRLGMKDSFFFPPPEKYNRIASVYNLKDGRLTKEENLRAPDWQKPGAGDAYRKGRPYASPQAGMFSTALDMLAFYQMMLNGGTYHGVRILSRASVDAMTALQTGELLTYDDGMGWGLGWEVVRKPAGPTPLNSVGTFLHTGGRLTVGLVDPKRDLVCLFMMQRPGAAPEVSMFMVMAAAAVVD